MCGITGILSVDSTPASRLEALVGEMADTLVHRGPDGRGVYVDPEAGLAFGHRRLSILDLSELGKQPMRSPSGRYVVTFNGEIYNFVALREQLLEAGATFRGGSDTEVLLAGFEVWGVHETLKRANGMLALGVWDRERRTLTLARDRMGKKPLYYGWVGSQFCFASELKAFRCVPGFSGAIDRDALAAFLRYKAVPSGPSIYRGVHKLDPGAVLELPVDGQKAKPSISRFWDPVDAVLDGRRNPLTDPEEAIAELDAVLRDAVRIRLESDVPLGAFLSGGIDSTIVVALMQQLSSTPTKTFSIGFHVDGYDEAQHASAVAEHLGTDHTELYVSPQDARDVIPLLPSMYDEPFADVSQIPTYLVSALARRDVTVALSGDGGDELFTGYPRYPFTENLWQRMKRLPRPVRGAGAHALGVMGPKAFAAFERASRRFRGGWLGQRVNVDRLLLLRTLLRTSDPDTFYRYLLSEWREPASVVEGTSHALVPPSLAPAPPSALSDLRERASFIDMVGYLPDDILVKVDRASMAVSLEARAPLLDYRVVELAWRMPLALKLRENRQKWVLQKLVWSYVPRAIMDRPKMGFGVPIGDWLRGPLREWAEALLAPERLRREGFLRPEPVQRRLREHLDGQRSWAPDLWSALMFQAWLEAQSA